MNAATLDTKPRVGAGFRLQWEPMQDCHVLLYPEIGMDPADVRPNREAIDQLEAVCEQVSPALTRASITTHCFIHASKPAGMRSGQPSSRARSDAELR